MARTLVGESGWLLAPVSPMWAIARDPLSNPDAALKTSWLIAAPGVLLSRQPTGAGPAGRRGGASGPGGPALKLNRKFSHGRSPPGIDLGTWRGVWTSFDWSLTW